MSKHTPVAACPAKPGGVRFVPTTFDKAALGILTATIRDKSDQPFLTAETALRFALGLAARVIAAGKLGDFTAAPSLAELMPGEPV